MVDLAVKDVHLAGGAEAVPTGVGQIDASVQAGVKNGLTILDFDRQLVAYVLSHIRK